MDLIVNAFGVLAIVSGGVLGVVGIFTHWKNKETIAIWALYATIIFALTAFFVAWQKRIWEPQDEAERAAKQKLEALTERPAPRPPIRGLLIPANDPSPPSPFPIPDLYKAIYFGDSVATVNPARNAFTLFKIAGEDVLSFENTASGILINAVFRDKTGEEIATITKNVFRATSTSDYEATSPDQHSLLILDGKDRQVLYVRYLNPKAIKVLGMFYHPKGRPPLLIEENGLTINGRKMHGLHSQELGIWPGQAAIKYE